MYLTPTLRTSFSTRTRSSQSFFETVHFPLRKTYFTAPCFLVWRLAKKRWTVRTLIPLIPSFRTADKRRAGPGGRAWCAREGARPRRKAAKSG